MFEMQIVAIEGELDITKTILCTRELCIECTNKENDISLNTSNLFFTFHCMIKLTT